jgi:hypothetical protein
VRELKKTVAADDDDRNAYLSRAKALLEQKQPVRTVACPMRSSK